MTLPPILVLFFDGRWVTRIVRIAASRRAAELDLFDRAQLERVLDVCRVSASLSEAGRTRFAVSRQSKKQPHDA